MSLMMKCDGGAESCLANTSPAGGGFFFISPTAATLSPLRLIDVTAFGGKEN